ncbi:hypothetical protein [Helicobacter rodentium]|uniref:hypothetical protein n=1 Tax=Helicobacter rodentium TaxID=59617 RepID=UPI002627D038|nr:hypothetical protein [Helicobacter rodentium]
MLLDYGLLHFVRNDEAIKRKDTKQTTASSLLSLRGMNAVRDKAIYNVAKSKSLQSLLNIFKILLLCFLESRIMDCHDSANTESRKDNKANCVKIPKFCIIARKSQRK